MIRTATLVLVFFLAANATASDIPAAFTQLNYLFYPEGVSSGGKVVVGNMYNNEPSQVGGSWVGIPAVANGVTADGTTYIGMDGGSQPVGPKQFPDLYSGSAYAVSASGKHVAGLANTYSQSGSSSLVKPFVWTETGGFAWLPVLPGTVGDDYVKPDGKIRVEAMSPDGQKIVGYNNGTPVLWEVAGGGATVTALDIVGDPRQVIFGEWDWLYQQDGMAKLKEFLIESTAIDEALLAKYEFKTAELAADGTAITGWSLKNGHPRGYLVTFDEAPFSMTGGGAGAPAPTPEPGSLAIGAIAVIAWGVRRRMDG